MSPEELRKHYPEIAVRVDWRKKAERRPARSPSSKLGGGEGTHQEALGDQAQLIYTGSTSGQFDLVFRISAGSQYPITGETVIQDLYIVVEAKGGGSKLAFA
jgi:hypothetical protein